VNIGKIAERQRLFPGGQAYVFVIFLFGWFVLHSSSGQQFSFSTSPANAIIQAIFFSFGAYKYTEVRKFGKKKVSFIVESGGRETAEVQ